MPPICNDTALMSARMGWFEGNALRANPFELLAEQMPRANHAMGDYTLVVAGMQFESGPGFILLAGSGRSGELLLDSTCAIAGT